MGDGVVLDPGWWCWLEAPVLLPGWGASPVFVTRVEPLKTGKGMLRLSFIQAIHRVTAREREVVLRVLFRGDRHLVGTLKDDDGAIRTAILAAPDYGWLETYCPLLLRRRHPLARPSLSWASRRRLARPLRSTLTLTSAGRRLRSFAVQTRKASGGIIRRCLRGPASSALTRHTVPSTPG